MLPGFCGNDVTNASAVLVASGAVLVGLGARGRDCVGAVRLLGCCTRPGGLLSRRWWLLARAGAATGFSCLERLACTSAGTTGLSCSAIVLDLTPGSRMLAIVSHRLRCLKPEMWKFWRVGVVFETVTLDLFPLNLTLQMFRGTISGT